MKSALRAKGQTKSGEIPIQTNCCRRDEPVPPIKVGKWYSLVVMDYFTKWPKAHALSNQETTTVAGILGGNLFYASSIEWHGGKFQ